MFWLGLDNFGSTWAKLELTSVNLGHFRLYSFLREVFISDLFNFGKTWVISNNLGQIGSYWVMLSQLWPNQVILGQLVSNLDHLGSFWVILAQLGSTCAIKGKLR